MFDLFKETGMPIGTLFHSLKDLTDIDRFLLCDGSSYDHVKYYQLFSILSPKFGNLLPDLRGYTLKSPSID